jgi:putative Mg2+ transporter-C (MgtC) family protein
MIEAIFHDFTNHGILPPAVAAARLIGAALLAGLIGFERELKSRPAGLRTHMLVSLASAMFAVLSTEVVASPAFTDEQVRADPLRAIEAVTAGVAFLAAGFIIFARGEVRGVTTGAGIWLAAAIGLSVGFGYWSIAFVGTIVGAIIIAALLAVEKKLDLKE